jgi:hypothetical protein
MYFIIPWKKLIDKFGATYTHLVYDLSNWRLPRKERQVDQLLLSFCSLLCSWLMFVLGSISNTHPFKEYSVNTFLLPKCTCARTCAHAYMRRQ